MCGIIGITIPAHDLDGSLSALAEQSYAAHEVYRGLLTLQHRGQDAAGIASYDLNSEKISHHKDHGLVVKVFSEKHLDKLKGLSAIGHNRYQTIGQQALSDIQPIVTGFPTGMALAHNGNIVNYHELSQHLSKAFGIQTLSGNDIEIILYYLSLYFAHKTRLTPSAPTEVDLTLACHELVKKAEGGYALIGLFSNGSMMGLRDPNGIRPLVLGEKVLESGQKAYCLTSESVALNFLGYELVRDINPGELIIIDRHGAIHSNQVTRTVSHKPCMFEWIYFSGAESTLEDKSVYETRLELGKQMGEQIKPLITSKALTPDIIVPVPDTSRTAAIALSETLNIPYREALIKNRYSFRSFILNSQTKREKAVELKLSPVLSEIKDKSILLVDDSIVRGTTSKSIIKLLKKYGAKKIYIAVPCPPITHPCFYGIDLSSKDQLIAHDKNEHAIAEAVGADGVFYLSKDNLSKALRIKDYCGACLDGCYPTSTDDVENFQKLRNTTQQRDLAETT